MTDRETPREGDRAESQSNRSQRGDGGTSRRDFLKSGVAAGALAVGAGPFVLDGASAGISTPRLHRDGNLIKDPDGNAVTLRGVNIADPKRIDRTSAARGKTAVQVIDALTDESDGWYTRVIRVPVQPVDIGEYAPGSGPPVPAFDEDQLERYLSDHLDDVVQRCADRGVYCIVDYHRHRDVRWAESRDGPVNSELQDEVDTFWNVVAQRYADESHVLYEVYNEPTEPGMWGDPTADDGVADVWRLWLEMAQPWVDTIRSHADNLILMGSPSWTQSPEGALVEEFDGDDVAYTYHIYPGHSASQANDWEDASNNGEGVAGVYEEAPLFVTEFGWEENAGRYVGGTDAGFGDPILEWMESSEAIHWTAWTADPVWQPAMFDRPFAEGSDSVGDPYNGTVPELCSDPPCEWDLLTGDGAMGDDVKDALEEHRNDGLPGGRAPTPTETETDTDTPTETPTETEEETPTETETETPSGEALVVNDYDGDPAWSDHRNDLGNWCGAGSFQNGGGEVSDGALELEYDDAGWFVEQVNRDVSDYEAVVLRVSGAEGGEADEVQFGLGGVRKLLSDVTDDSIGTSASDVRIDMASAGVDRSSPGELRLNFWQGGSSTLRIEEIRIE